jgi:hypothetical protein
VARLGGEAARGAETVRSARGASPGTPVPLEGFDHGRITPRRGCPRSPTIDRLAVSWTHHQVGCRPCAGAGEMSDSGKNRVGDTSDVSNSHREEGTRI